MNVLEACGEGFWFGTGNGSLHSHRTKFMFIKTLVACCLPPG